MEIVRGSVPEFSVIDADLCASDSVLVFILHIDPDNGILLEVDSFCDVVPVC